jgi:hypothetical protein
VVFALRLCNANTCHQDDGWSAGKLKRILSLSL